MAHVLPRVRVQEQQVRALAGRHLLLGLLMSSLVAQRGLFEMSREYLEHLETAWRSALRLEALLAGDGLDPPSGEGTAMSSGRSER